MAQKHLPRFGLKAADRRMESNVNDEYTLGGAGCPDLEEILLLLEDNPPLVRQLESSEV